MIAKHMHISVLKMAYAIGFMLALLVTIVVVAEKASVRDCIAVYLILFSIIAVTHAVTLACLRWKCCLEDDGIAIMKGNRIFRKTCYKQILEMSIIPACGPRAAMPLLDGHGKQICVIACSTKKTDRSFAKDHCAFLYGGKHCIFPENMKTTGTFVVPYEMKTLKMLLEKTDGLVYVSAWAYERFKKDINEIKNTYPERIRS